MCSKRSYLAIIVVASLVLTSCRSGSELSGSLPTANVSGIRHLEFDKDVITDPHVANYVFVKGTREQYLFPDAEVFKTPHTIIIEAYAHIFVFPATIQIRYLSALTPVPRTAFATYAKEMPGLDSAGKLGATPDSPSPSPICPDCVEYIDGRLYDRSGKYLGVIDLAKVMKRNAPTTTSERRHPLWRGWPGICGDRSSPWYFDTYCIDDYYFGYETVIEIIWSLTSYRSPGVVSYDYYQSGNYTNLTWNWSGIGMLGQYLAYQFYTDIRANFESRSIPIAGSHYGTNITSTTGSTYTNISQMDVVIESGYNYKVLGSRVAVIATTIL